MQHWRLIPPTEGYEEELSSLIAEFEAAGERIVPHGLNYGLHDPAEILGRCRLFEQGLDLPTGYVPSSTRWLVDEDGHILGACNIRHRLNDHLLAFGGHIGYGVRPSRRRQGCATEILRQALTLCPGLGITRALVTCNQRNEGSRRTILKCGGQYEDTRLEPDGNPVERYWIEV